MKSKIQDYIVIDVETGGLPSKTNLAVLDIAITEIALVYVSAQGEILGTYDALIQPYNDECEYNPKAAEVSGISKTLCVKEGKEISYIVKEIKDFIKEMRTGTAKPVMVGHNIREFDSYFVENLFMYCGDSLYDHVHSLMIDTMEEAHKIYPESENYKLGTVCRMRGIELTEAHRALPDTISTAELWISMLKDFRGLNASKSVSKDLDVPRKRYTEKFKF